MPQLAGNRTITTIFFTSHHQSPIWISIKKIANGAQLPLAIHLSVADLAQQSMLLKLKLHQKLVVTKQL